MPHLVDEFADLKLRVTSEGDSTPTLIIEPSKGWAKLKLGEVWSYRELLYFLIWREVKVRYKQTALGAAWAIIQPLFTMLVFSLFFGRIPYPRSQTIHACSAGRLPIFVKITSTWLI